jgi:hypothetical protein
MEHDTKIQVESEGSAVPRSFLGLEWGTVAHPACSFEGGRYDARRLPAL